MTHLSGRRVGPAGAVLLLLAVLSGLPIEPLGAQVADREVVRLEFRGNRAFDDAELASAISTRATRCRSFWFKFPLPFCPLTDWGFAHERHYLSESELPADVVRLRLFYRRRGYRDVRVDTMVDRRNGEVALEFEIEEGPPTVVSRLDFEGLTDVLDPEAVRSRFPLAVGEPFDLVALSRGKQAIVDRLRNRGYVEAAVLDEYFLPAGERTAEVAVRVRPGPRARIREIRVEGAGELGEGVVRQFLTFEPGEYYRQDRLLESQRELYRLGAIRVADVQHRAVPETDTLVDVEVSVTPARPRSVRTGVGLTTTSCFETEARFTHRNFLGGARRLQLTGQLSNLLAGQLAESFPCRDVAEGEEFQDVDFSVRADLLQPSFLSDRNTLETALFVERQTVPDLFVRNSRGGEASLTRRLQRGMSVSLTYRPEFTSFEGDPSGLFFCINFGFCQPADIGVITAPRWLAPVTLGWSLDRTNVPLSPTAGYYVNLALEGAETITGSDYQYLRFNVDAAAFEELLPGLVLATRIRTGFVEPSSDQDFGLSRPGGAPVVHPRKRFFAGGAQSVRGFGQNLLGPTVAFFDSRRCAGTDTSLAALVACADSLAALQSPGVPGGPVNPRVLFDQRPVGGNAVFEANVELRARVAERWTLVGFVDMGQVWEELTEPEVPVATPGVGVRYSSPLGPLRVDVGYDPTAADRLPVVAQVGREIRELPTSVTYREFTYGDPGTLEQIWRRLQLHISIGEAF